MTRRSSARRAELVAALDREGRRTGSTGSMHAKALADRAGVHSTDFEALDVLDWSGPISAGELAKRVGVTSGAITGSSTAWSATAGCAEAATRRTAAR